MKKCDVCHYREALITGLFSSSMVSSSRSTRLLSPPPSPASPPLSSSYASPIHMDRVTSGDLGFGHDHNPLLEQEFEQIRAMKAEYDHIVLQDEEYVETLTGLLERRLESALDPNTNYVTKQSIAELQYALKEKRRHREVLQQEQERLSKYSYLYYPSLYNCMPNNVVFVVEYMKAEILRRKNELNGKIHERQKTAMAVEVKRELLEQHLYPMIKKQSEVLLFRRMEVVMGLFKAMPIAVDADSSRWDTLGTKVKLRGYSSIMGLPLPNHGLFDGNECFYYFLTNNSLSVVYFLHSNFSRYCIRSVE